MCFKNLVLIYIGNKSIISNQKPRLMSFLMIPFLWTVPYRPVHDNGRKQPNAFHYLFALGTNPEINEIKVRKRGGWKILLIHPVVAWIFNAADSVFMAISMARLIHCKRKICIFPFGPQERGYVVRANCYNMIIKSWCF